MDPQQGSFDGLGADTRLPRRQLYATTESPNRTDPANTADSSAEQPTTTDAATQAAGHNTASANRLPQRLVSAPTKALQRPIKEPLWIASDEPDKNDNDDHVPLVQSRQPLHRSSTNPPPPSIIQRLKSIGTARLDRRNSRYAQLGDSADHIAMASVGTATFKRPASPVDDVGFDISTFEGPAGTAYVRPTLADQVPREANDDELREAKGELTGGLGKGMDQIVGTDKIVARPSVKEPPKRQKSLFNHPTFRKTRRLVHKPVPEPSEGQEAADASGEIVAVDLSNVEGGRTNSNFTNVDDEDAASMAPTHKQSYYFPPDPEMPNWKPFPMRWWYILMLVVIAALLGGLQEFLCEYSEDMVPMDHGMDHRGLLTFINAEDVGIGEFFMWKYFPTIVFVTYGAMWQAVNFEVLRLEPYYQLSQPGGALAKDSLNLDYITTWSYIVPFRALKHRHWAVVLSSLSTLLSSALAPIFQSASLTLYPDARTRTPGKPVYVRVAPVWSRLTTGTFFITFLTGAALLYQLRRKSGLLSDPKGIAGLAAMANKSHILQDFRGLDTAPKHVLDRELKHRRYILHKSSLWQGQYVPSSADASDSIRPQNPHPKMLQLRCGIPYLVALLAFAILLPIISFTNANIVTEKAPWLLTTLATILKLLWHALELAVRSLEPWYILAQRRAPASVLTMDYNGTFPGLLFLKALLAGNPLVALVGLGSVLCELLVVCVSSFNVDGKVFAAPPDTTHTKHLLGLRYSTGETFRSFWASFGIASAVLVLLMAGAALVLVRRRTTLLPRQPATMASVLAYIHQSAMLYDFVAPDDGAKAVEAMTSAEMARHLAALGHEYGLGWYRGRDGSDHLGVDQEPLLAGYRHGVDWRHGRVSQIGGWETF